jgi:hypothetical protein
MKFLADAGISLKTLAFLNAAGHDAVRVLQIGLQLGSDAGSRTARPDSDCATLSNSVPPRDAAAGGLWRNYDVMALIWSALRLSGASFRVWQASNT